MSGSFLIAGVKGGGADTNSCSWVKIADFGIIAFNPLKNIFWSCENGCRCFELVAMQYWAGIIGRLRCNMKLWPFELDVSNTSRLVLNNEYKH